MKYLLTTEEREALQALTEHTGYKALLKVIDSLVREQQEAVLRLSVDDGVDRLVHVKLRAEGAAKLRADVAGLKKLLKEKES